MFNKLHNLLLGGVAGNKVIKISDNINTDAAGQVVLGGTEGAGQQAGEQGEDSLHLVVCDVVEILIRNTCPKDLIPELYLSKMKQ